MLHTATTFFRRLLIFIPGVVLAYVATFEFFPYIDQRTPFLLAVLITYCLTAYVAIPGIIRVIRLIHQPKHIPLFSVTPDGLPCDPINVCFVGTQTELQHAMHKAGWYLADKRTPWTVLKTSLAILGRRSYPTAPFSPLYLFGRKQDFGFQIPIGSSPYKRHHIRFWQVGYSPVGHNDSQIRFWRNLGGMRPAKTQPGLWVAAATLDTGLGIVLHNWQIDHRISGDTNAERDFVVSTVQATGLVRSTKKLRAGQPYTLTNRVLGTTMVADGEIVLVNLRRQSKLLRTIFPQDTGKS